MLKLQNKTTQLAFEELEQQLSEAALNYQRFQQDGDRLVRLQTLYRKQRHGFGNKTAKAA